MIIQYQKDLPKLNFKLISPGILKTKMNKKIKELEKNEKLDKNLLRFLTVKFKKLDLETDYFKKSDDTLKSNNKI